MGSSKSIPCGPCYKGEVSTKADIWCYNCDEGLCLPCSGHHKKSKGTCDHKTIDIKSYKESIQAIKTECDKHGQQLNLYCPSHLRPCCDECISTSHSKCTGIKSLAGVVENTKIKKSKETVEAEISSILNVLNKLIGNKSENIKTGEIQCASIKKSITEIRKEINKHLDHLEKTLCQEIDSIWNQEKSKVTDFISEIEVKTKNLKEMKEHLQTVTTHNSKLQSFLGVHQIEQHVHQCQRYVQDLEDDERVKEFDIKMKQNKKINKRLRKLGSLESLAEVIVVRTEVAMNIGTNVNREAQAESQEQSNINNMTMKIETKKDINTKLWVSDMICLMDGRVIAVERWEKVKVLTSNGKLEKQLLIPGRPEGITLLNKNTIAISDPWEHVIRIFNMENETVSKVIKFDQGCNSLSFFNNSLAVGMDRAEIRIIDLEGNTLKSIEVESESFLNYLVYCNDRIIYSDRNSKAVYCVDESGNQIWQYKQGLSNPEGLCTDSYGNIFVVDKESRRIIVISKDGKKGKVLFVEESMVGHYHGYPTCICFKRNESSGFICDEFGSYLTKFSLSYG